MIEVRPANEADCGDLRTVFGDRGGAAECQCQRYRLARGEGFKHATPEVRAERLREQTACGDPDSPTTTGLVAYADGEPVGWCAVAPRNSYDGLVRNANQTAWAGRDEDRSDDAVVLTLHGELDLASADSVQQRLDALAQAGTPVRLDLDGLRFMDSSGLRVILQAAETSRSTGWVFTITPGSEQVRTLFASAGITGRLPIAEEPT